MKTYDVFMSVKEVQEVINELEDGLPGLAKTLAQALAGRDEMSFEASVRIIITEQGQ